MDTRAKESYFPNGYPPHKGQIHPPFPSPLLSSSLLSPSPSPLSLPPFASLTLELPSTFYPKFTMTVEEVSSSNEAPLHLSITVHEARGLASADEDTGKLHVVY